MTVRAYGRVVGMSVAIFIALLWGPTLAMAFPNISCGYRDTIFNGEVDFGSGTHSFGGPAGNGSVTWTFTSSGGAIVRTARIQGTLYLDKIGPGCARLRINFQDNLGNNLEATQDIEFCGPGNNANLAANQQAIDVTNVFPSAQLRRVQLTLGAGSTLDNIVDLHTGSSPAPSTDLALGDRINSGVADFGFGPHQAGAPQQNGSIALVLRFDGVVIGRVNGVLFWDALFGDGTVRAVTNFQNRAGTNLVTRTTTLNGTGCCASDSDNQALVDHRGQSADLFKIRLRVGQLSNGSFVGVTSRTYSFGCGVGTAEAIPVDTTTRVGEDLVYGVQWTVPEPENWHSLRTLDIRLVPAHDADVAPEDQDADDAIVQADESPDEILRLRFDEAANTFSKFNPHTERFGEPSAPGSSDKFQSAAVTLLLAGTEVIGSGPEGPSVRLNLNLEFKQKAAGRRYTVQVLATDDSGLEQGWDSIGEITVSPRAKRNR